ncbi:hypothetical protein SCP_0212800 [Sparassis crispa]|uniref:Zn(2)-C6 fungal-type domain-containing protein n=1 Tax=Sparassis crispa TaxID=139825 RepID=A0A401GD35_9APHY|nr:hypothetical protein SCP_0212800 [Sparassis crispa]GBE80077.1 hypothetical protein SCP_0212800 [Sparassis crispa]
MTGPSSDDERLRIPPERQDSLDPSARRRSTRACDHCRRSKSKCERGASALDQQSCRGCLSLGLSCTYVGPSHKRGPPKGYILAIERRLHQVEALLGTIIGSDDLRARSLVQDLSQDDLARQIIHRVEIGPFGPRGRVAHPFGSTKEDFLASIMNGVEISFRPDNRSPEADVGALVSPSSNWQDCLYHVLRASGSGSSHESSMGRGYSSSSQSHTESLSLTSPVCSGSSWSHFQGEQTGWDLARLEKIGALSEDSTTRVSIRTEDVYIDRDRQLRIIHPTSGLHTLSQYCQLLANNNGKPFELSWPSTIGSLPFGPAAAPSLFQPLMDQQQNILVHYFFNYVHPMYPVINRTYFMVLYNEKFNSFIKGPYNSHNPTLKAFEVLLLCIFSISARYLDIPGGNRDSDEYAAEAVRLLGTVSGISSPLLCQVLLLLGYRSFGIGEAEDAWTYIGMAVRMAYSLGLHRRVGELASASFGLVTSLEQETRQQLWAGCVIADRFVSVLLGRPSMILDGQFDISLVDIPESTGRGPVLNPSPPGNLALQPEEVNENVVLSCFNASCALSVIVGSIANELYPIDRPADSTLYFRAKRLEDKLSGWMESTSSLLNFNLATVNVHSAPCIFELQLHYWWAVILLHRVFIYDSWMKCMFRPGDRPSQACTACQDAAGHISSIVTVFVKQWEKFASAFLPGYILAAGAVDLMLSKLSHHTTEGGTRLRHNLTALRKVEVTWPMASIVQKLLHACPSNFPTTSFVLSSPHSGRKRSTGEASQSTEHREPKTDCRPQMVSSPVKDLVSFDTQGRVQGLGSALGIVTSPPCPGFQDPGEGSSNGSSLPGVTYSSATMHSLGAFGLW